MGQQPNPMDVLVNTMQQALNLQIEWQERGDRLFDRQNEIAAALAAQQARIQDAAAGDQEHRRRERLSKLALDIAGRCPTFERGKDRWVDFEQRARNLFRRHNVPDDIAKETLWNAITGRSSKIVVASMNPSNDTYVNMALDNYLAEMAGKFTPASESTQMKAEYKSRKQGKAEDVQNYINEKYELYKMAYPHANDLDMADFYQETTKGIANRAVRTNLWVYEPHNIAEYSQKAVFLAQVERQRIAFGDSDSTNMDGLVSVTKTVNPQYNPDAMEVDYLRQYGELDEDDVNVWPCMSKE